ncbi:MAG: hypothetical protein KGJ86_06640, partial [Chloroflexota bacterium]|nr:hypothetical protein [Chloroflexota bacterium]
MSKWVWVALGLATTILGLIAMAGQAFAGGQPWDGELSDNLIFAKSIPFSIGFGVLIGALRATVQPAQRSASGAVRRFSPGTAAGHWIGAGGLMLALLTGSWQYLGGVLEVNAPLPLYFFYRAHFIGATLLLFSIGNFVTHWLLVGDTSLLVPKGLWLRHVRGLAHEAPSGVGSVIGDVFGLDMKRTPPPVEQFTYYEKVVSFPTWAALIALITATGLLKAMRYVYPIPGDVL